MRCFIAIDIDESLRKSLGDLQRELAGKVNIKKSDVKWVKPESIHLTLNFLGQIKDEKVVEICNIAKDVAARNKCFDIDVGSVGCFGGRSARVLWVGVNEGKQKLAALQKDLQEQLAQAGWPIENREFAGHLTLCRIRNPKAGLKLAQICEEYDDFEAGSVFVDSLRVYESQLQPTGPVYTVLGNYNLGA